MKDNKIIKIGCCNFWETYDNEQNGKEFNNYIIEPLIKNGLNIELLDCNKFECDIVFISGFYKQNRDYIKGNPIIIMYSGEHPDKKNLFYLKYDYSLTFFKDNINNLYYPLWQINYDRFDSNIIKRDSLDFFKKDKFCCFIVSNPDCHRRNECFNFISQKYKKVDSMGSYCNNVGKLLPSYKNNFKDAQKIISAYKFNLCFENDSSKNELSYITEKIIHAYAYGTIPVYWGSENISKWFDENSFINCNGLSNEEILQKIIEIDNNKELFLKMYLSPIFKEDINWREYAEKRLYIFITNILNEKNK